jgi:hypothetical protein
MSAAKAGAATDTAASAAAPSRNFFIIDPRYVRCDINPNNVTSIRLLWGNAGAPMVRNCDGAATKRFSSFACKVFSCVNQAISRFVDVEID